jgi:hypothetical protein
VILERERENCQILFYFYDSFSDFSSIIRHVNLTPYNFIIVPLRRFISHICIIIWVAILVYATYARVGLTSNDTRGLLFVVDTSLSMSAEDIAWTGWVLYSRLDTAKALLQGYEWWGDVWLLTFASEARLQIPLSHDTSLWERRIAAIQPVPYWSPTDIETALMSTQTIYGEQPLDIVLITDGEVTTDIPQTTQYTLPDSTTLTIIGVGTPTGAKIVSHYDGDGRIVYKKYRWNEVISRLDRDNLEDIADDYGAQLLLVETYADIPKTLTAIQQQSTLITGISYHTLLYILGWLLILCGLMLPDYQRQ